jgi:hypothetical protein
MLRVFWLGIVFFAYLSSIVLGNWNDTSTGIDLDRLRHFPLVKIRAGRFLDQGSQTTFDGITATAGGPYVPEVRLTGAGKSGKQWEAYVDNLDEVWRADLDGNGTQDYVFFGGGPYFNGRMTPLFSLSFLLMDDQGIPVPFFTAVYHGENGDGIKHLVDLNDGHAGLLISTYDEIPSDAFVGPSCSGHWTTQLYRFNNLGAAEIKGAIGAVTFPFIHDWTYRGTLCDRQEKAFMPARQPVLYENGTNSRGAAIPATLKSINDAGDLLITPVATCRVVNTRVLLYDRPKIRKIVFPNLHTTSSKDLASTILREGAHVELQGIDRSRGNGGCTVNLLWAK